MPQPPTTPHLSRSLIRPLPFAAQSEFNQVVTNGASLSAIFEIGENVSDANQIGTSPAPAGTVIHATGPFLDAVVYWEGGGAAACTLTVDIAIGLGVAAAAPTFRNLVTSAIAKTTTANVSGLRITGRYVKVTFTNASGADTTVTELGIYLRSN